jgi:nitrite reductase (NADH) large subunit
VSTCLYFSHHTAEELSLVREGFYEKHGVKVLVGERAITINRQEKVIHSSAGVPFSTTS